MIRAIQSHTGMPISAAEALRTKKSVIRKQLPPWAAVFICPICAEPLHVYGTGQRAFFKHTRSGGTTCKLNDSFADHI